MRKNTTIEFVKEKETKGTVVYRETDSKGNIITNNRDCQIGSIYVQKCGEIKGDRITIHVEHD
jgi:hypothetical protein